MEKMENKIRVILKEKFQPRLLEIINESGKHHGHAHAKAESHFFVRLQSQLFEGKSTLQQHRLVYEALKDIVPQQVHALRLETRI